MLRLPVEVVEYVLKHLYYVQGDWLAYYGEERHGSKNDLLSIRTVCKKLANAGAGLAFRHITFVPDEEGYRRLRALSNSQQRMKVRRLTYEFEDFVEDDYEEEEFEGHSRRRQYQIQLHRSNLDVARLTAAFALLGNLKYIQVSQRCAEYPGESAAADTRDFLDLLASRRVFDTIAASLCATDTKITDLTLRTTHEYYPSPLARIFQGFSPSKTTMYYEAFSQLKVLKMTLPVDPDDDYLNFEGLSAFICSLPALKELALGGVQSDPIDFPPCFLPSLQMPRLRSIEINDVTFACSSNLTEFLARHSQTLQRIKLHDVILGDGSWEDVFSSMRNTLNLLESQMTGVFYKDWDRLGSIEIGYCVKHHGIQVLPGRSIEDFIERRTDVGPFDLLRKTKRRDPQHLLLGDIIQCNAGVCPCYLTPEEAEKRFMERRKAVTGDEVTYVLDRHAVYVLFLIFSRQGKVNEECILRKIASGEESDEALQSYRYHGCRLRQPGRVNLLPQYDLL